MVAGGHGHAVDATIGTVSEQSRPAGAADESYVAKAMAGRPGAPRPKRS